jgi:hypothetical protein
VTTTQSNGPGAPAAGTGAIEAAGQRGTPPRPGAARKAVASGLLAAACVAWSAAPLSGARGIAVPVLAVAAACAALSVARLALGVAPAEPGNLLRPGERLGRTVADLVRMPPSAEGAVIGVLVLEALHRSRPWHTGLLGAALLAYLVAVHLAESRARLAVLRPQAPLIAAGLGLLVLAAGAAALPAETGSTAELMAVLAALAAAVVGGLVVPV